MAPALSTTLTLASPLFSSKSNNTQNQLSLRTVFLHQNNKFSCSGLKWKLDKRCNRFVIKCYQPDGATIDLKLPRRSLLVHFTCNVCGVRSQKIINRLAYEKGMVFVQCTGCSQYHKLVDNLNLVVEYDFREEIDTGMDADQA